MEIRYITNKGLVREQNEDSLLINDLLYNFINMDEIEEKELKASYNHFFVADGLGGEEKGEVASRMVLEQLVNKKIPTKEELLTEIKIAKEKMEVFSRNNNFMMLGTTLAGVVISKDNSYMINIGDTRVYEITEEYIEQRSVDHTLASEEVQKGRLAPEKLRTHPIRNFLTSSINGSSNKKPIKAQLASLKLSKNKIFLILSDGVWEQFDDSEIHSFFINGENLSQSVKNLYEKSYVDSKDNLSIVAIRI